MASDREIVAQQLEQIVRQNNPDYPAGLEIVINDDLINLALRNGVANVFVGSQLGYKYWEFEVGAIGGFEDENLNVTGTGSIVFSGKNGVYFTGQYTNELDVDGVSGVVRIDPNGVPIGAKISANDVLAAGITYDNFTETTKLEGGVDLKAIQVNASVTFDDNGEVQDASLGVMKDFVPTDLILGPQATVRYATDDNVIHIFADPAFYGTTSLDAADEFGNNAYSNTVIAFSYVKDDIIDFLGLPPDDAFDGTNTSYEQARVWFLDLIKENVEQDGLPLSVAIANNVYGFVDDPSGQFDASSATLEDVLDLLRGEYDPNVIQEPSEAPLATQEEIIAQYSQAIEEELSQDKISAAGITIEITVENEDGSADEVLVNPVEQYVDLLVTEFTDAVVYGVVISTSTETLVRLDGSTVDITTTEFVNGGESYVREVTALADGSLPSC